jgi:hypothetical protein
MKCDEDNVSRNTQAQFNLAVLERLEKVEALTKAIDYKCHKEYSKDPRKTFNILVCEKY